MLAWVMNMGFAASQSGSAGGSQLPRVYTPGLSLLRLGVPTAAALLIYWRM